jgi:hypothetical protein
VLNRHCRTDYSVVSADFLSDITARLACPASFDKCAAAQDLIFQMRQSPIGSAAFLQGNSECPQDK